MAVPYLPLGISAAIVGGILLFAPRSEAAQNGYTNGGTPGGQPGGGGTVPFPSGAALGVVSVTTGERGMNVRSAPSPTASLVGSAPNGETVAVLSPEVPEAGAPADARMRWRQVQTRTGARGYARFVGPRGEANFRPTGAAPWPGESTSIAGTPPRYGYYGNGYAG